MMEKLTMQTPDFVEDNIAKLAKLFPNCVTETLDEKGGIKRAIDFEQLKQEMSSTVVEDHAERFHLSWPGKKASLLMANTPIHKTLRPVRQESVDFDSTNNLFIEGDNLDALKLLQETYLAKIKMIYIDPPYNTGKDFIYNDKFAVENKHDYLVQIGAIDEEGHVINHDLYKQNMKDNGRFHSDWLSMMYPRLKLARNLLRDDGVIFISIDDGEQSNLKRMCDEIFGEDNFRNTIIVKRRTKSLNSQFSEIKSLNIGVESILVYSKSKDFIFNELRVKKAKKDIRSKWQGFWSNADRPTMRYSILGFTPRTGQWRWQKSEAEKAISNYVDYLNTSPNIDLEEYWKNNGSNLKFIRRAENSKGKHGGIEYWQSAKEDILRTTNWTDLEISEIHKEFQLFFTNPKNPKVIQSLIELATKDNDIVLDFFAGSGTTAHAVINLNAKDGESRKFIMVQLPESLDNKTDAFKAGFKTIADISKERIRLVGNKVKKSHNHLAKKLDVGFRTLKVGSSNMAEVYYTPDKLKQESLAFQADNIKEERSAEDLLFQVLLDWGVDLTLPIQEQSVLGLSTFFVNGLALIACFDKQGRVNEDYCREIASNQPMRVVFRDAGFANDGVKINIEQIFKHISPSTDIKTL